MSHFLLKFYIFVIFLSEISRDGIVHAKRPHIIIMLGDDMGFNDVSYHAASECLTPNIDAIGYQGMILNRYYASDMCTPSRAALLTGRYPVNTGMQNFVIRNCEPFGLPLDLKILPEYLKEVGYRTHLVGKWHLGFCRKAFTPTKRGFDTFFGYYTGAIDYFTHLSPEPGTNVTGYDFRRNLDVTYEGEGVYSTYLFTNESLRIIRDHNPEEPLFLLTSYNSPHAAANFGTPLEAPQDEIDKIYYVKNNETKIYAAMVAAMDRGIGQIVAEFSHKKMLSNSIVIFYSDNGVPEEGLFATVGSNYPFRGQKHSPWEGGLRVPAVLWSPWTLKQKVSENLIQNTDWMPTFLALAGVKPTQPIDGYNIWPTLTENVPSPRYEIINNINPIEGWSSYYYKGWKYINGTTSDGMFDEWYGTRAAYQPFAGKYPEIVKSSLAWKALAPFSPRSLSNRRMRAMQQSTKVVCQPPVPYATECKPLEAPCLFKINEDPCEINNVAAIYPFQTYLMHILVKRLEAQSRYPVSKPSDYEACDPRKFNGTYTWWVDLEDPMYQ
ncbi:arylsulfatase B-like isoform X2 [Lutzomyia longipalpis]|uniref:arylsulfatase B-like isoform X2 n=1 Tax=Lutzomyia longipalpis TaxID=7200 RepID=UPI002483D852|nr:arylsulfatase B-like isoform X2 [Lutzomyia longipalpis]